MSEGNPYKIVFIGNPNVGKTCIIHRKILNKFNDINANLTVVSFTLANFLVHPEKKNKKKINF